ncbi:uncharacterized protein STEHIDRAFT_144450 [Stereum hirsutum FP-91666 SS1]|uniref:uncharacterized protein n=1 Tax=Stereum hirsutum (strain FP-91666) TaxID=721885 RepID=UPI000440D773|nr:uncharacterized protein STEHIDRAFT_144450 [Stereum hirsutum FP-91666 SS1]EIM90964.1 hypothetical protein STEHIDRAFT_144450 [Stereum hirsutum FP-91666 SS1]
MRRVQPQSIRLFYNPSMKPLCGSFKTMHVGTTEPPLFAPTSRVAVKQAYSKDERTGSRTIRSVASQIRLLSSDIFCRQWAHALTDDLVYRFIESHDKEYGSPPSDSLWIPQFRYVDAALAIRRSPDGDDEDAFLLEELVDGDVDGRWRKYINNNSSVPIPADDLHDQLRSEFLAFCQHVQYWKTSGLAFVTDFQGGNTMLSDPQIITHPGLGDLFSNGNLVKTHSNFENEHACNAYCEWYGLPKSHSFAADSKEAQASFSAASSAQGNAQRRKGLPQQSHGSKVMDLGSTKG